MTTARIHCQVLEMPAKGDWHPCSSQPRDLLPWADPYIARLIGRLEDRYNVEATDEDDLLDPFSPDNEPWLPVGDDWEDAFIPRALDAPRHGWHPPVFGGFPLLDDLAGDDSHDA